MSLRQVWKMTAFIDNVVPGYHEGTLLIPISPIGCFYTNSEEEAKESCNIFTKCWRLRWPNQALKKDDIKCILYPIPNIKLWVQEETAQSHLELLTFSLFGPKLDVCDYDM